MPIDPSVVAIILDAYDRLVIREGEALLTDILAYVDARWRVIPSCEELEAALAQRPSLGIVRRETGIVVARDAKERVVEPDDLQRAYREYKTRFQSCFVKGNGSSLQ